MESIELLHKNQIFTIIFEDDLAFSIVRAILDNLMSQDAFNPETQAAHGSYEMQIERNNFKIWVAEMEVIIQKL
jgi:hypothetical protein